MIIIVTEFKLLPPNITIVMRSSDQ